VVFSLFQVDGSCEQTAISPPLPPPFDEGLFVGSWTKVTQISNQSHLQQVIGDHAEVKISNSKIAFNLTVLTCDNLASGTYCPAKWEVNHTK